MELRGEPSRLLLLGRHGLLELSHLGHERIGIAPFAFGRADGLGRLIAALLHVLQQAERLAMTAIEIDKDIGLRRHAAPGWLAAGVDCCRAVRYSSGRPARLKFKDRQ